MGNEYCIYIICFDYLRIERFTFIFVNYNNILRTLKIFKRFFLGKITRTGALRPSAEAVKAHDILTCSAPDVTAFIFFLPLKS